MSNLNPQQFKYIDADSNTSGYHRVAAIDGGVKIGHIDWDGNETGRVNMIHVDEEHRRKGVASSLWNEARAVSGREGLIGPEHDAQKNLSGAGLAWSKAVK
jgi:ribosomal protein S18 acetylase RimI-like enzyme